MKFTIPSSLLSARLQTIGRVIVQKNTMPILDSFMFDIQGSRLVVTAGDNETVLTTASDVTDCDTDTLLYLCVPEGPTCHTGAQNCFFNEIWEEEP